MDISGGYQYGNADHMDWERKGDQNRNQHFALPSNCGLYPVDFIRANNDLTRGRRKLHCLLRTI